MRVMVLGAGGMLGRDLVASAPPGATIIALTHAELDITDTSTLACRIREHRPQLVFNAAAYTAVDRGESDSEEAFRVNADAVGELGRLTRQAGASVVHFSTDYVFDGATSTPYVEDSLTGPINCYGASKLAGENLLKQTNPDSLIVRTQWLFGPNGKSFPRTMWDRARSGAATRVVHDHIGRPTYTQDLAPAAWQLAQEHRGIVHVANHGTASWFDVATQVFAYAGRTDLLAPCLAAEYSTPARRPPFSVLDTTKMEQTLGRTLPPWQDALKRFLTSLSTGL